jgi:hypothetical protein
MNQDLINKWGPDQTTRGTRFLLHHHRSIFSFNTEGPIIVNANGGRTRTAFSPLGVIEVSKRASTLAWSVHGSDVGASPQV